MNVRGFSQAATDLKVHLLCLYATEQNKVWKSTHRKVTLEITGNIRILLLRKSTKLNHFNSAHSDQSSFQPVYRLPYTHSRRHVTSKPNWILGKITGNTELDPIVYLKSRNYLVQLLFFNKVFIYFEYMLVKICIVNVQYMSWFAQCICLVCKSIIFNRTITENQLNPWYVRLKVKLNYR